MDEAMRVFFSSGCKQAPQFLYALPDECVNKSFEENRQVCMELLPEAKRILERVHEECGGPEAFLEQCYGGDKCSADELKIHVENYLNEHNILQRAEVSINDGMLCCASVFNPGRGQKYVVNISSSPVSCSMVQSILDHEIGTHLLRMMNDEAQPWHGDRERYNLLNPWITEEGFATLNTYLSLPRKLLYPQALRYFAVCRGSLIGFVELFHELKSHVSDNTRCFQLCCRIKRGMHDTSLPGAFNIDQAYFKGAVEILRQLDEVDILRLYGGQLALQDLDKVHNVMRRDDVMLPKFMDSASKLEAYKVHCRELIRENQIESATKLKPKFLPREADFFNERTSARRELRSVSRRRRDAEACMEEKKQDRNPSEPRTLTSPSVVPDASRRPVSAGAESKVTKHRASTPPLAKTAAGDLQRSRSVPALSSSSSSSATSTSSGSGTSGGSGATGRSGTPARPRKSAAKAKAAARGSSKKCAQPSQAETATSCEKSGALLAELDISTAADSKEAAPCTLECDSQNTLMQLRRYFKKSTTSDPEDTLEPAVAKRDSKSMPADIAGPQDTGAISHDIVCSRCETSHCELVERKRLKCANPECDFLVNSNIEMGGYCCRKCCSMGGIAKVHPKNHNSKCERMVASCDASRASALLKPERLMKSKAARRNKMPRNSIDSANCSDRDRQDQIAPVETSMDADRAPQCPAEPGDVIDVQAHGCRSTLTDVCTGNLEAQAQQCDAPSEAERRPSAMTNKCKIKKLIKAISETISKPAQRLPNVSTEVPKLDFSTLETCTLSSGPRLEVQPSSSPLCSEAEAVAEAAVKTVPPSPQQTGDNDAAARARKLFKEASELLVGARELFGNLASTNTKCLGTNCTFAAHRSANYKGYCCKRCCNISSGKRYSMEMQVPHSSKCERIAAAKCMDELPEWF